MSIEFPTLTPLLSIATSEQGLLLKARPGVPSAELFFDAASAGCASLRSEWIMMNASTAQLDAFNGRIDACPPGLDLMPENRTFRCP
jgi:hypothetical protein